MFYFNLLQLKEAKGSTIHTKLTVCYGYLKIQVAPRFIGVIYVGLKWEKKRQSVSDRIHYGIRDL